MSFPPHFNLHDLLHVVTKRWMRILDVNIHTRSTYTTHTNARMQFNACKYRQTNTNRQTRTHMHIVSLLLLFLSVCRWGRRWHRCRKACVESAFEWNGWNRGQRRYPTFVCHRVCILCPSVCRWLCASVYRCMHIYVHLCLINLCVSMYLCMSASVSVYLHVHLSLCVMLWV